MNKQIVIAGLLGAAVAQPSDAKAVIECDDPFVAAAKQAKADLETKKATLATAKTTLAALAATEATAYATALTRYNDQNTLMAPFVTARDTANTNHKTKADASAAAAAAITALAAPITAATTALTASEAAVTAQNTKITAQDAVMAKLNTAVTEHTALEATMIAALTTATTAETTATTAVATALAAKTALETIRDTATTGWAALKTTAETAATAAAGALTTAASTEQTKMATMKTAKMAVKASELKQATINAGCTYTGSFDCSGQTNDPIKTLKTAQVAVVGNAGAGETQAYNTAKTAWDTERDAVATKQDLKKVADVAAEVAVANNTTSDSAITTAGSTWTTKKGELTTATAAKSTATTNKGTATAQKTQAVTDQTRGQAVLTKLKADLTPLTDDVVVKKYLKKVQDDKKVVQTAAKAAADLNLADLATLKTMAEETVTRAKAKLDFYNGLMTSAKASKDLADGQVTANGTAITANTAAITGAEASLKAADAACKGMGFLKAQAAMKALIDKKKADAAAAASVKTAYEAKAAFATGGETNTLCTYPKKATAAAKQDPRPVCKDGFCCGAAQKFMRDGTKISVETCQKAVGTHTYTYYPPLMTGAIVEPTPETWRFQCISGAQKLAAVATAALAASYMMA